MEQQKNKSKHTDSILKLFNEINVPFPPSQLNQQLPPEVYFPPFNDNYLATSVFTAQSPSPGALSMGYDRVYSRSQRLPDFCSEAQLRFHSYQEVFPPAPGISLFKPPSIRALITVRSGHWFPQLLPTWTGSLPAQAWASASP